MRMRCTAAATLLRPRISSPSLGYFSALVSTATCTVPCDSSRGAKPKSPKVIYPPKPKPAPFRLAPMPTIRDVIKLYKLSAIKQLSQNFILDEKIANKIVKKGAGSIDGCYVCEVGPGPGNITRSILSKGAKRVLLIEKDKRFKQALDILNDNVNGIMDVYWGDVLSFNLSQLFPLEETKAWNDISPRIHIIGNLPFSVSTPLIIRWLRDISNRENAWRYGRVPLTLTFQLEVAERLAADVNHAQRCRLSIMAQHLCLVYNKFTINGSAFVPKPDVDVGVVKFIPRREPLIKQPFNLVEKVVRQTFSMRQKYCRRGIATLFPELIRQEMTSRMFKETDINPETRSFQLSIEEFDRLCNTYAKICKESPSIYEYNYRGHKPDEIWEELYGKEFQKDDGDSTHESTA